MRSVSTQAPDKPPASKVAVASRAAAVVAPLIAAGSLALMLVPPSLWSVPTYDAIYTGFDPNLMYSSGSVRMTSSTLELRAASGSDASANLLTTPLQHVAASLDASVMESNRATEPLRIGVWTPWSDSGEFVVFGPQPQNSIAVERIDEGIPSKTLVGGQVSSSVIGHYALGSIYHLSFDIDDVRRVITVSVSGTDGTHGQGTLTSQQSPKTFARVQVNLTASSLPDVGSSRIVLSNFMLRLYHERVWASKTNDPRAIWLLSLLGGAGLLAILLALVPRLVAAARAGLSVRFRALRLTPPVIALVAVYLVGNAALFPLGTHPFDMGDQQLFAYVARSYGTDQLFFLPNVVSLASVWGGVPYGEFAFPYEAVTAYLSTATGWLASVLFAGGGIFTLADPRLVYLIKSINVVFGLADSVLIYSILKRIGTSRRWSIIPAALFLFNPAVWFSMSVWGQTHVISLFLVLVAIYFLERQSSLWAWMFLALACLTRPQMLVFGLLLGIVFFRKFTWRENLSAISWTVIAMFVILLPLTLRTDPSLPLDVTLHNLGVQEGGGNNPAVTTVSQGAYSIWPLVTYIVTGASGTVRAFTPSAAKLIGSFSYQQAGQVLTLAALLVVAGALWVRRRTAAQPGGYLPLVTLGIVSFLMFLTGIVSTHFLLALPFLLMCRRWMSAPSYFFAVTVWSLTTLIPMFGDMGATLANHPEQLLSPDHNSFTRAVISLYSWDRFITAAIVANLCVVVWLAIQTRKQPVSSSA